MLRVGGTMLQVSTSAGQFGGRRSWKLIQTVDVQGRFL